MLIQKNIQRAAALLEQQRFAEAQRLYAQLLKQTDRQPSIYNGLAQIALHHGRVDEAMRYLKRSLKLYPDQPQVQNSLACMLGQIGRYSQSMAEFERLLNRHPDYLEARHNFGMTCLQAKHYERAEAQFNKVLKANPYHLGTVLSMRLLLCERGRFKDAATLLYQALDHHPLELALYDGLVSIFMAMAEWWHANRVGERAIQVFPSEAEAYLPLIKIYGQRSRHLDALKLCARALIVQPGHGGVLCAMADLQQRLNQPEQALNTLKPLLLREDIEAMHLHTQVAETLGRFAEASCSAKRIIKLDAQQARAFYYLARSCAKSDAPQIRDQAKQALDPYHERIEERMYRHFALGHLYEKCAQYDQVVEQFKQGNAYKRMEYQYNAADAAARIAAIADQVNAQWLARASLSAAQASACTPIFVMGMMRSGTTLTEQILASHPQVQGCGELNDMIHQVNRHCPQFPDGLTELPKSTLSTMREAYLARVRPLAHGKPFIVDKMPLNVLYAGLIRALFPEAILILCSRDALNNCWSIFKILFAGYHPYVYDLTELGRYYQDVSKLCEHWQSLSPLKLRVQPYEALIDDLPTQAEQLLRHCGLDMHPDCLRFYENRSAVRTASASQVRKPIYRDSMRLAQRYGNRLFELEQALSKLAPVG